MIRTQKSRQYLPTQFLKAVKRTYSILKTQALQLLLYDIQPTTFVIDNTFRLQHFSSIIYPIYSISNPRRPLQQALQNLRENC